MYMILHELLYIALIFPFVEGIPSISVMTSVMSQLLFFFFSCVAPEVRVVLCRRKVFA